VIDESPKESPKEPKKKRASSPKKPKAEAKETQEAMKIDDSMLGKACPICGKGIIIKGKTAYGCSDWKNGCTFRQGF
jgi:DNA topoisomerase-3